MRTRLKAALSVLVTLSLVNLGATGCGCKEAESSLVVQANAGSAGNRADARPNPRPKPDKNKKKPCKKGGKQDTRGTKAKTKGKDRGTFKTRAEAVAARAKDMKGRDPLFTKTREECSPKKCHLHLDLYPRDRRPGNKDGPLETWHYTYHRR